MSLKKLSFAIAMMLLMAHFTSAQKKPKSNAGVKLYKKYECASCHGKAGNKPFDLTVAWKKYDESRLKQYIMRPKDFGNTKMPPFETRISEEDYPDLIAYIITLGQLAQHKGN